MCQAMTEAGERCSRKAEPFCVQHAKKAMRERAERPHDWGRNREAAEATIVELLNGGEFDGAVRGVDAAQLEVVRSLADVVDLVPGSAQLWRQYREALEGLVPKDVSSDPRHALVAELRAAMGDPAAP